MFEEEYFKANTQLIAKCTYNKGKVTFESYDHYYDKEEASCQNL